MTILMHSLAGSCTVMDSGFSLEQECKRSRWTRGYPVRLADGSRWELPSLRPGQLAADPELATDLREALAIARAPRIAGESKAENLGALCRFHGLLAVIAIRLLKYNYNLPDHSWEGLLICDDMEQTLLLATTLGFAIDHAMAGLRTAGDA